MRKHYHLKALIIALIKAQTTVSTTAITTPIFAISSLMLSAQTIYSFIKSRCGETI